MIDLENNTALDILKICQELCEEVPSFGENWDTYWKNPNPPFKSFRITPADKKYSEITLQIRILNNEKEIKSLNLEFQSNTFPKLNKLETLLGKASAIVIGPSNPGYRDMKFTFPINDKKKYQVTIFGRMNGYEVFPTSEISSITLRRDKTL